MVWRLWGSRKASSSGIPPWYRRRCWLRLWCGVFGRRWERASGLSRSVKLETSGSLADTDRRLKTRARAAYLTTAGPTANLGSGAGAADQAGTQASRGRVSPARQNQRGLPVMELQYPNTKGTERELLTSIWSGTALRSSERSKALRRRLFGRGSFLSQTALLGIVKHLAGVEIGSSRWSSREERRTTPRSEADPDADWRVEPHETPSRSSLSIARHAPRAVPSSTGAQGFDSGLCATVRSSTPVGS